MESRSLETVNIYMPGVCVPPSQEIGRKSTLFPHYVSPCLNSWRGTKKDGGICNAAYGSALAGASVWFSCKWCGVL